MAAWSSARALGNRSILASPLNPYSTENLNIFIKHREPFRKFAASVPGSCARIFRRGSECPLSATVGCVRPAYREQRAAATGGRPERAHRRQGRESAVLNLPRRRQGDGLLVLHNTSFNLFESPCLHAARCRPQLLFLRHRRHVRRQLFPAEVGRGDSRPNRVPSPSSIETRRSAIFVAAAITPNTRLRSPASSVQRMFFPLVNQRDRAVALSCRPR